MTLESDKLSFLYAIFSSIGVATTIISSIIMLRKRDIPLKDFRLSLYFMIPIGVLGGSFFGKLGTTQEENWKIWEYFYFWKAGMSIFGALFTGSLFGFVYFYKKGRRSKISITAYADCIVPNVLLGQSIGRWGNLFNHEILGNPIDVSKINWLPTFIWKRLYYIVDSSTGKPYTEIIYREPLFLYESVACLISWVFIVFIISNLGKWFSKKPWNVEPEYFPCKYNKKYKTINFDNIKTKTLQIPITYKTNKKNGEAFLSFNSVWNKAYYYYEPPQESLKEYRVEYEKFSKSFYSDLDNYDKFKREKKILKKQYREKKDILIKKKIADLNKKIKKYFWKTRRISFVVKSDSRKLSNAHNPNNYFIIRSGTRSSMYLIIYSIIRMCLEYRRPRYEMFIKWNLWANYTFFSLFLCTGIMAFMLSQFILPNKLREEEWFYEKSY